MKRFHFPRHALALIGVSAFAASAFAQSSSSSSSSTTSSNTGSTATAAPAANAASATTTAPQATAPTATTTVPSAPFAPPPVVDPVARPVVPPTTAPAQGTPVRTAPGAVTQPVGPAVPGQVTVPPGAPAATTAVDANGQIVSSGAAIDALAAAGVEVALDPQNALTNLRRANADGQAGVTAELQTRVDATNRALTEARAAARASGLPTSDSGFDQAMAEVRAREDVIRETLRNASRANSENEWRSLQSLLDSQYSAYADAVLRARSLMQQQAPRG